MLLVTGSEDSLPWGRTKVVFDVMDTVVRDPFKRVAPEFFGMSLEELFKAKNSTAWFAFERGDIDEARLSATYFNDGRDFDLAGLREALVGECEFVEGMPELLADLREVGHELHAFTNYPEWYTRVEERLRLEEAHGLQWTCVSCDTGLRKPEPAAYLQLLRRLGVGRKGAAPVLLIDDQEANCESALRAGIRAIRFRDAEALRGELADVLGSRKRGTAPQDGWPEHATP